jgi:hypothetical protein
MTRFAETAMNRLSRPLGDERGIALLLVLLIAMAVGAMALTAVLVSGNSRLVTQYEEQQDDLEAVADAGLELARARINATPTLYPDSGYAVLENGVTVTDPATGRPIPGVKRYTYVGPTGVSTGQFGVFGGIVTVAEAPGRVKVIRRGEVFQESFAKFAYFTDVEPSNIAFGSGDQIQGPVHSNDDIQIYNSGATFRGPGQVTTAGTITGRQYGTFLEGYQERVPRINLPRTTELDKLKGYAQAGSTAFTAPTGGNPNEARIRLEFIWIDLNTNGNPEEDEGFFRVYTSNQADWLMAREPGAGWPSSANCGTLGRPSPNDSLRVTTPASLGSGANAATKRNLLKQANSRCFLGGAPELTTDGRFTPTDSRGSWRARGYALSGSPPAALTSRPDAAYLFPLSRRFNPNFKQVIHVTGRVAISGVLRGRITLAATDDIMIVDDLTYATDPGAGTCADILGLFSGTDVILSDNAINTPQRPDGNSGAWKSLDDTPSEFVHAVVLALNTFTAENYDSGPTTGEACEGVQRGRGCLYLTGGIIQRTRGGVGTTTGNGYLKRYSYDACAYRQSPPYFPTTGRFGKSQYFEIDPNGFDVRAYYDRITAG